MTRRLAPWLPTWVIFLTACSAVRLLAPYDEVTDLKTAELEENILLHLNTWDAIYSLNPDSSVLTYQHNLPFYIEAKTVVELLLSRNEGVDKNNVVTEQLNLLKENLADMAAIHKEDTILGTADLESFKTIMTVELGAIQKFQQVRKSSKK